MKEYITPDILKRMRLTAKKDTLRMSLYAGVQTRRTYQNWENGKGSPNINQFLKMAAECGFAADQLIKLCIEREKSTKPIDISEALVNKASGKQEP